MKKIIFIATLLVFVGCSNEESKESTKEVVKQEVQKVVKETKKEAIAVKKVEIPKAKPVVKEKTITEEKIVKKIEKVEKVQEIVEKTVEEKPKEVIATGKSGEEIFKACTACHGAHAEKAALGKSKIIKGWDTLHTSNALHGYKDGTYGGAMKALMKGQVGFLNDKEIQTVSEYISKL